MKLSFTIFIGLTSVMPLLADANILSLNSLLTQVREKNQTVLASQLTKESSEERKNESSLLFKPSLFAQAQTAIDKKPTTNVGAQGNQTDYDFLTTGLTQQFNFGMQGKISYTFSHTEIHNANPMILPLTDYRDGVMALELSDSLWKNFLGKEIRSQENIINAQREAVVLAEDFKVKSLLVEVEARYWALSQMRKIVQVQKENLDRALKIKSWAQNRFKTGLGENTDLLQADANYKAREYELKSTIQDLKILERGLNSLRGMDSDSIPEELETMEANSIQHLKLPSKIALREDTKAEFELLKIKKANAELSIEKNKPIFDIYGSYAVNGRNADSTKAITNSLKTDHDTKAIGLRFSSSIDFFTMNNNIEGYKKDQEAAEMIYERKVFDEGQQWSELSSRFEDAKIKLSLVEKIEEAQKIKASNERERLKKGRTVTFQVLNFEQDYAQARLARIQVETSILSLYSQLKIFSAGGTK